MPLARAVFSGSNASLVGALSPHHRRQLREKAGIASRESVHPAVAALEVTEDGIFARIHVAALKDGRLIIPANLSVLLEIGVSDRSTLDQQLLEKGKEASKYFLVSAEPLLDKYARGLSRSKKWANDNFQPLGFHHERGIILPFAVGDGATGGEVLGFNVGRVAGCSSLMPVDLKSDRLKWCRQVKERREVPRVTLREVLGWISPRPVELLKVDAQGMDLRVIESAGDLLPNVRRFQLEVVADDCHGLYVGQPNCSTVVARAAQLGYAPASPVFCLPSWRRSPAWSHWRTTAFGCEYEVVFVAHGVGMEDDYWRFHQPNQGGCERVIKNMEEAAADEVVLAGTLWRWGWKKDPNGKVAWPKKKPPDFTDIGTRGAYACLQPKLPSPKQASSSFRM